MAKYHNYGWYLSRTRISRISRIYFFVASNGYSHLVSMEKLRRSRKSVRSVRSVWEKSTFNINNKVYGFTKLHQAGVSPALFSGFRPGRGKSPSDEMDSKMHPALRAAQEEWIYQEQQGVQSSASILYFLPFGRALIFISDNR